MLTLNPLENPDALWQHITMILVSAVIGYIIGYIVMKQKERDLNRKLQKVENDLAICLAIKSPAKQSTAITLSAPENLQIKEDLEFTGRTGPETE